MSGKYYRMDEQGEEVISENRVRHILEGSYRNIDDVLEALRAGQSVRCVSSVITYG